MSARLAAAPAPVTTTVDLRRLPQIANRLRLSRHDIARRAGCHPSDVSRIFAALTPGEGLVDRLIDAVTALAAETETACPK